MANFNDKEILKRIDVFREKHELSMNQFSQLCGIDQGNLSKVKNGKGKFSEKTLFKIAKGMKSTFEWLTTGCGLCGVEGEDKLNALDAEFQGKAMKFEDAFNRETLDKSMERIVKAQINNTNNGHDQTNNVQVGGHDEVSHLLDKIAMLEKMVADKDNEIAFLRGVLKGK